MTERSARLDGLLAVKKIALFVYDPEGALGPERLPGARWPSKGKPGSGSMCVRRGLFGWRERRARGKTYTYHGVLWDEKKKEERPYIRLAPRVLAVTQKDVPKLKTLFRRTRTPSFFVPIPPRKLQKYLAEGGRVYKPKERHAGSSISGRDDPFPTEN